MKRFFTCAIITMIASLAFAQAPVAKKATRTVVEKSLAMGLSKKATEAKAFQAAQAEKAAAPQTTSTSVYRRAGHVSPAQAFAIYNDKVVSKLNSAKAYTNFYKNGAPARAEQEGNVTVTYDANGIITDVTGVAPSYYDRAASGTAYYLSGQSMYNADQSGVATMIIDGDNVYMKDPITRYTQGSWVKGVKEGNTISVASHQPLAYNSNYGATISLRWGVVAADGSITATATDAPFVFNVDGDVLTLQDTAAYDGSADAPFMGAFWDDDDFATGYGDAETVLTLDSEYVAPSTDLVVLPDGATVEDWFMNATEVTSSAENPILNQAVKVAFVGDDVYVSGFAKNFPNAWIKGVKEGNTITFANFQYLGAYGTNSCWAMGYDEAAQEIGDPTATIADGVITFTKSLLVNAATDRVYYLEWYRDIVLSAEQGEEPVITDLTATLPYVNGFDTEAEQAEAAIYDANLDGSTFSFYTDSKTGSTAARYRYHSTNDANDYVVFPGVELNAGVSYKVKVDARPYSSSYPERLEVVAGKVAKASELNIEVIHATELTEGDYITMVNGNFQVAEDGVYYIALHAISDADAFYLYADNFSISVNDDSAPVAVSDLAVEADANGANKATVSFTVPATDLAGDALTGNLDVVVKRDGEEVKTLSAAAGSAVSFEDEVPAPGFYTYSVVVSQDGHVSDVAQLKAYIGEDTPGAVENLTAADKSSQVALAWEAPVAGLNDGILIGENLKYNVYPVEVVEFLGILFPETDYDNPYATGLTDTAYNVEYNTNEGEHQFTYFCVTAENAAGESKDTYAAVVTGKPLEMPYRESCEESNLSSWWGFSSSDEIYDSGSDDAGVFFGQTSSDGDDYCFLIATDDVAGWIELESPKFNLAGAVNPVVTFDHVVPAGTTLDIIVVTPEGQTVAKTITGSAADETFSSENVSLVDYANADFVRIFFKANMPESAMVYIDNIRVFNQLDNNLAAAGIAAPSKVNAGDKVSVNVTVENQGSLAVTPADYTVDLYCNGEKVQSLEGVALASDAKHVFAFEVATNVMSPAELTFKAKVEFAADEDASNNETAEATTKLNVSNYPTVNDLAGTRTEEGVALTWSEPSLEGGAAEAMTEDFEEGEPFATSFGEWTMVDADNEAIGGIEGIDLAINKCAWYVMDNSGDSFNASFDANSGTKYMATMYLYSGAKNDDWMISPVLTGDAQTVTFFAKSYTDQYGLESIEVLASSTGKEIADFTLVKDIPQLPAEWTEYSVELPAGTKYFAIRYTSQDIFMAFVDDVTFTPAGNTSDLALVGYNVYRDGEKLNDEPIAETSYLDTTAGTTDHVYVVTVVYDRGESGISNVFDTALSGISNINVEGNAVYYNVQGVRVANPEKGIYIKVVNGKATKEVRK